MNKISIIIPVYNVEKYLSACIESIIGQTYQNLEIILIDDGSTDSCAKICDDYAAKDSRIKVIHKENGGLSDARNAGYELVTGDYLSFVDSDDMISAKFSEKLLDIALTHQADIVECEVLKFREEHEEHDLRSEDRRKEFNGEKAVEFLMKGQLKQVVWNKLYRTATVNGHHFEKGKIHEDEYWTYQVFGSAGKIVKTDAVLYFYRQQQDSIMAENYSIKRLYGMEALEERILYVAAKFPRLTGLAVQTFWYSAFNNYQAIVRHPGIDSDFKIRKNILKKVEQHVKERHYDWKPKDRLWLKFFLAAPEFCSRLRNLMNVGV